MFCFQCFVSSVACFEWLCGCVLCVACFVCFVLRVLRVVSVLHVLRVFCCVFVLRVCVECCEICVLACFESHDWCVCFVLGDLWFMLRVLCCLFYVACLVLRDVSWPPRHPPSML